MRHFLAETDFSLAEISEIFSLAARMKKLRGRHVPPTLEGQTWVMLFFKNSTRTRISFEVGIAELGGNAIFFETKSSQLGRGESIADTARVMGRYAHGLIIRTFEHQIIEEFAAAQALPIVNALTDLLHPCQAYSDFFTMAEAWTPTDQTPSPEAVRGRKVAFLGDASCNMAHSLALMGRMLGAEVVLSGPSDYAPGAQFAERFGDRARGYRFVDDPAEAARDADVVYTDVWVSMGADAEAEKRRMLLRPYQVDERLMALAKPDALFMHCLPAHPGEEVSAAVYEGERSIVFDQAENRLHVQKGILSSLASSRRQRM